MTMLCRIRSSSAESAECHERTNPQFPFFIAEDTVRIPGVKLGAAIDIDIEQYPRIRGCIMHEQQLIFQPGEIKISISQIRRHVPGHLVPP